MTAAPDDRGGRASSSDPATDPGALRPADAWIVATLAGLAGACTAVALGTGLPSSPDSGYYLYAAARLALHLDPQVLAPTYAPAFPLLIALGMPLAHFPGTAATLLLGACFGVSLVAVHLGARWSGTPPAASGLYALVFASVPALARSGWTLWTEGLMYATTLVLIAAWTSHLRSGRRTGLWVASAAAAFAPLVKYVAVAFPLVLVAAISLRRWRSGDRRAGDFARDLAPLAIASVPAALYFGWNWLRVGAATGVRSPAEVGLATNVERLAAALDASLSLGFQLALLVAVLVVVAAELPLRRRPHNLLLRRFRWAARGSGSFAGGLALAMALLFAALLLWATSTARVGALGPRYASPIVPPLLMLCAQSWRPIGRWLRGRSTRRFVQVGLLAALLPAAAASCGEHLGLAREAVRGERSAVNEPGYLGSPGRAALGALLLEEAERAPDRSVSLSLVPAGPHGYVARGWLATAVILGASPFPRGLVDETRIASVGRERIELVARRGEDYLRVLHLPVRRGASPDPQLVWPRDEAARRRRERELRERRRRVLDDVVALARREERRLHWLVVSERAAWLHPERDGDARAGHALLAYHDLPGFAAFRLAVAPAR